VKIRMELEAQGIETHWTMVAAAHDYRETLCLEQQIRENPNIELAISWQSSTKRK